MSTNNSPSSNDRDMFFTPTSANNNGSAAVSSTAEAVTPTEASNTAAEPSSEKSSTYSYPKKVKEPRKFIDKDELHESTMAGAMAFGKGTPHFSLIEDSVSDAINPITGRSIYFGLYPWRCSDRATDWIQSIVSFDGPRTHWHHLKMIRKCSRSDLGDEPLDDYVRLPKATALFYKERAEAGMMRLRYWEQYPYEVHDLKQIGEADAVRMRTWRQQRRLEEVAKNDHVEDLIRSSVLVSNRTFSERKFEEANPYLGAGGSAPPKRE